MSGTSDPTDPAPNPPSAPGAPTPPDTVDQAGQAGSSVQTTDFEVKPAPLLPRDASTKSFQGQRPQPSKAAPANVQIPGYEVIGELGRGAMGVVYKARQVKADRLVALKLMLGAEHADRTARERFDREAQAAARLQHPNIIQIFEVGELDGMPYFTLEFVAGGTLAAKVARDLLPPREAAGLVRTLARATQYAHEQQIVHRDLKPSNLLLTPQGEPKIADFGLAKKIEDADSSRTRAGTVVGTPSYMAPEQARGEIDQVGPAADTYALGAILYELLTGRPPFKGVTVLETLEQVQTTEPVAPGTLQPKVPRDLETICLKCLQKEPGKRYGSAGELADDLQRYLDGEPIRARPIGPVERLWRWARRNPRVAGLTGAVAVLLVALAAGGLTAAIVINESRRVISNQKEEVERQKTVAEERLGLVRRAVDTFVTDVPEALKNAPFAGQAREDVLRSVNRLLTEAQGKADDAGVVGRGLVGVLRREGDLLRDRRDWAGAEKKYQEARRVAEEAYRNEPTQKDKAAGNLAVTWTALAELAQRQGAADRALENYQEALKLRQGVVAAPQSGEIPAADARASLGATYYAMAQTLRLPKRNWSAALENARRAEALLREAVTSDQVSPELREQTRRNWGLANLEVGRSALELGQIEEAKKAFQQAIQQFQALVQASPRNTTHLVTLEVASAEYGDDLVLQLGQPAEARPFYEVALRQIRAVALSPEIAAYQRSLSLDHYRLGTVLAKAGDRAGAARHFALCRALREVQARDEEAFSKSGAVSSAKNLLMLAQARCGEHEAAVRMAAVLLETGVAEKPGPDKNRLLFLAASGYGLSAEWVDSGKRKEYLGKALQAMQLAVAGGYRNRVALETDPDLDPLRESAETRDGYQELLRQVRAPSKP
jgi:serine/threonine-protein kinase